MIQTIGLQYVLSIDFYRLTLGATCAKARGPSLLMRRQWIDWCKRTYASRCWLRSRAHKKKYLTPQYFQVVSRLKIRFCKSNWSREIEFETQSITVNNLSSSFSAVTYEYICVAIFHNLTQFVSNVGNRENTAYPRIDESGKRPDKSDRHIN